MKRKFKTENIFAAVLISAVVVIAVVMFLWQNNFIPHKMYTNEDFGIETYKSEVDKDSDGIDDQTDILERLLMCTIHSNYSNKNEKFGCLVKMNGNPILGNINYSSMLQGTYLVTGCSLDFRNAQTTLSCVGYSDDTALLSDIPYD